MTIIESQQEPKPIDITPCLKFYDEKGGSDLFFSTATAIHMEIEGETMAVNNQIMTPGMVKEIAYSIMSPAQITEFESTLECNFAHRSQGYWPLPHQCISPARRSWHGDSPH